MNLRKNIISFVFLALTALSPVMAKAMSTRHHFEAIPGSYNHLITTLHQDHNGMVWVGTATGVCRFDGYSIIPARTEFPDSATFINGYIQKICEDSQGRLWVKTEGQSFGIYDPVSLKIYADPDQVLTDAGIPTGLVNDIQSDKDGSIWIAMANDGLYKIPNGIGHARKADFIPPEGFSISNINFNKFGSPVIVDESGALTWIDPHSLKTISHVAPDDTNGPKIKENYMLTIDHNNRYWVFSPRLIEVYDGKEGKWISNKIPQRERHVNVKHIYQDDNGILWIVRDNHGLEQIAFNGDQIHFITADYPDDATYKNTLTYILKDNAGTTFLGSYKKGLFTDNNCIHKFSLEKLPDVNCMTPADGPWVWVGTDSSGLWKWNTSTGEKYSIPDPADGDTPGAITSLATTKDGTLYVGAFQRGLRRVRNGKFENVNTGSNLDICYAWSVAHDGEGGIWVASLGRGVFHYNPATGEIKEFNTSNSGLRSDYLTSALKSKDGNVYFGHSGGIDFFNASDNRIHDIKSLNKDFDTSSWKISQLFEDSRGLLWVATSQGLKLIDREHGKMMEVATYDGKTKNYITGLIEDNNGTIWVSEGRVLTSLNISYAEETGNIDIFQRHYDMEDGLMDSDFNQRSFAKLPSGEILLGGLYGVNHFKPTEIQFNSIAPRINFTDLYISNQLVLPGKKIGGKVIINEALRDGGEIQLPHSVKDFIIYFTTDNYALPDKTVYKYKLEGYDDGWRTLSSGQHSVTYTNLSPGNYSLLVIGINNDGYESLEPAIISIKVSPSIWRTVWAYIIYVILFALAVFAALKLFTRFEKNRLLKIKEDELNQLKYKFFKKMGNDFRTPLIEIMPPLDGIIQSADNPQQRKRLRLLKEKVTELLSNVNILLDIDGDKQDEVPFDPTEGDVVSVCKRVFDSFASTAERKRVNYTFQSSQPEIIMAFDEGKLEKIIHNLIDSAIKFTPPYGTINVSVEKTGEVFSSLRIKVADTGNGIQDKDKEFIFDSFYHLKDKNKSELEIQTGIALNQVSKYVGLHRGTVKVTDNVETGSVFIVELPIDNMEQTNDLRQSADSPQSTDE